MRSLFISILLVLGILLVPFTAAVAAGLSQGQMVYAPIYSQFYSGDRERPLLLAATLSIRNIDPNHPITIVKVDYHDSEGKLLQHYLESPVTLSPAQSTRYVVKFSDKAGGYGPISTSPGKPVDLSIPPSSSRS